MTTSHSALRMMVVDVLKRDPARASPNRD